MKDFFLKENILGFTQVNMGLKSVYFLKFNDKRDKSKRSLSLHKSSFGSFLTKP